MKKWIALHGFLGKCEQWNFLENLGEVHAIDLYPLMHLSKDELLDTLIEKIPDGTRLIGYSMGGRIAMELFLKNPNKFSQLYILASHPGLESQTEIKDRLKWENMWIDKISKTPKTFIDEWNRQEIFQNDQPISMPSVPIDQIKKCIEIWGLSKQEFLIPKLKKYNDKIVWLIGSEDKKYKLIAGNSIKNHFYAHCVTGAGHRLLQYPDYVLKCLKILDRE